MTENGWQEWSKYVLKELERLNQCSILNNTNISSNNEKITVCLTKIKTDIAGLKVKAGIWGVIGGSIPVTVTLIILAIRQFLS